MWFASPFIMGGKSPTWRDDLIQMIYSLLYLYNGLDILNRMDDVNLMRYKLTSCAEVFCKDNNAEIFGPMLEEVYNCSFEKKPDYGKIKKLFRE